MTHPEPDRAGTHTEPVRRRDVADDLLVVRKESMPAVGPLMFLPFLALFVVGLWLLGNGYENDSGLVFVAGILVSGISFLIPVGLLRD